MHLLLGFSRTVQPLRRRVCLGAWCLLTHGREEVVGGLCLAGLVPPFLPSSEPQVRLGPLSPPTIAWLSVSAPFGQMVTEFASLCMSFPQVPQVWPSLAETPCPAQVWEVVPADT